MGLEAPCTLYFAIPGCLAEVYVTTAEVFSPGYTTGEPYPDLLQCEFTLHSRNPNHLLSIVFEEPFEIKAADSLEARPFKSSP